MRSSKCEVCGIEIKLKFKKQKHTVNGKDVHTIRESDEGVLFVPEGKKRGKWFCNSCWKDIVNKIDIETFINR